MIGVVIGGICLYEPLVLFAASGATVPLSGFGYTMSQGVKKAIAEYGALGILTGGMTSAAAGITAAIVFGYLFALVTQQRDKT